MNPYFHLLIGLPILSLFSGITYQLLFGRSYLGALISFFLPFWFIPTHFVPLQRIGLWFIFGSIYGGIAYTTSSIVAKKQTSA